MTLAEKLAVALGLFLLACVFVLWALLALDDRAWERAMEKRQKDKRASVQELEDLYRLPSVLTPGQARSRVERWRRG